MIHQNVRNIILHISVALKCDCSKPNVPINMKICRFLKKIVSLTYFHSCCDMNIEAILLALILNDRACNRHYFGTS